MARVDINKVGIAPQLSQTVRSVAVRPADVASENSPVRRSSIDDAYVVVASNYNRNMLLNSFTFNVINFE